MEKHRCGWCLGDSLYEKYHDTEWGMPVKDDGTLFEFLVLETFQAGLSWITVLKKRQNYHDAFDHFNPRKIAHYDVLKIETLLLNKGIIRNKRKIEATVQNARSFLRVQKEFGAFDVYIWQFIGGKPRKNRWNTVAEIPDKTKESLAMSKDLRRRGFAFVGPTICYAFMQATGMVNDHTVDCFRYHEINPGEQ